jgi:chromosome segregation ATPase
VTPVLAVLLVLSLAALAWSFWLTSQWHERARTAEAEYERIAAQLGVSEQDNQSLLGRQQELAAAKAQIEDERVALEQQKAALEAQSLQLADQVDLVSEIATRYNECSSGYSRVIAALDAQQVTQATVDTLRSANAACASADRLVERLDR